MKRLHATVQEFGLYGERAAPGAVLRLHIEDIQSRSRRYHWEIAPHRHSRLCQVLFIADGPASIHVDETSADVDGPAVAIIPPGTVHAFGFSAATNGFVLTLPVESIPAAAEREMRELLQSVFSEVFVGALYEDAALAHRLEGLLERLLAEFHEDAAAQSPITGWLANSVLWLLARHVSGVSPRRAPLPQRAWLRFRALAEAHYHEQWNVTRYARELGLTAGRLNRLCREHCGHSASRVLAQRLALEARRRLIYVDMPISRLAGELGFQDAAYFCRFFKRHAGASPRAYRRQALTQRKGLSSPGK